MGLQQESAPGLKGLGRGLNKTDLEKRKNDEEQEEAWVQCDSCSVWVHQICGMFNKGRNSDAVSYVCPMCLLEGGSLELSSLNSSKLQQVLYEAWQYKSASTRTQDARCNQRR